MRCTRIPVIVAVALLLAAARSAAQDEVWTPDGLESFSIYSLAVGPSGTSYAGTLDGIFRSTEPGVWTLLPNTPVEANVIVADPSDPDTIYTGSFLHTQWGVHKSEDGGAHFVKLEGFPVGARCIAIDPATPDTVYIGGDHPQVYKTADGGATWTTPESESLVSRIAALIVDPSRPGTVYAGSDQGEEGFYYYFSPPVTPVMRSVDSGAHFTGILEQEAGAPDSVYTRALALDSRTGTLYAATRDDPGSSLFRSADAGATWERISVGTVGEINALVVDPGRPGTLYLSTSHAAVLRSVDGGSSWVAMSEGLPSRFAGSLALDSGGNILRVTDGQLVFATRLSETPYTCTPTANRLCLLGGRYQVTVSAANPRTGGAAAGIAIPGGDRFGSFSLPAFTGDPALPEVFVKMIDDAAGLPLLVFHGGLTSLPYTLTVIDTVTGQAETYRNDSGNRFCGGVDGSPSFDAEGDACEGCWDYVRHVGAAGQESETLSLLAGRFAVTLSAFSSRHGRTEPGVAVPTTDRFGYFSIPGFTGDATLPEVFVKMVDYTAITGNFWFFYTGLTSLDYTLTVTDTVTGAVRTYESPGDYCGSAAADAFEP